MIKIEFYLILKRTIIYLLEFHLQTAGGWCVEQENKDNKCKITATTEIRKRNLPGATFEEVYSSFSSSFTNSHVLITASFMI